MNGQSDVTALLPPVEVVDKVPAELLPGLVAGFAALQARAAARLTTPVVALPRRSVDADEVSG